MTPTPSLRRSSATPIHPSAPRPPDTFLLVSFSPGSFQSISSDTTDGHGLDDLDELEIWDVEAVEIRSREYPDPRQGQASLPPRVATGARMTGSLPGTRERRSPFASPSVNGLSSLSPRSDCIRSPSGRLSSCEAASRRIPAACRMVPRVILPQLSPRKDQRSSRIMAQSAPRNIPDWSELQRRGNRNDDDSDKDEERIPPHEYLAREYGRSQMITFSVFQGAGRTLKGRDLRQVRDAVLTYTGFLE